MQFLGTAPSNPSDLITKEFADATYTGGSPGPTGPVASQVFVQQTDPEVTDPEYSGPAIWYETNAGGTIINKHVRVAPATFNPVPTTPWNGGSTSPLLVPADEIQPIPHMLASDNLTIPAGSIRMTLFTAEKDMTVSTIGTSSWFDANQSGATYCRVGVYRCDSLVWPFNINCIARSAHSAARWTSPGGLNAAPIVDNGAASPTAISSVSLTAGQTYGVALLSVGHTGSVKVQSKTIFRKDTWALPLSMYFDSQTALPPQLTNVGWFQEWDHPWVSLK